jgi:hypothetical protein
MVDAVEAASGRTYTRHSLGSLDDLRQAIADTRRDSAPAAAVMLVYVLFMLTGRTALDDLQNGRYPDFDPDRFAQVAARALAAHRAA